MACMGLGAGLIGIYGFFVKPLSEEFNVGVATLNIGPLALLVVPGLFAPFVGKLVDRIAIRRIMLVGAALSMFALMAVSQAAQLWLVGLCFLGFALGMVLYGPVSVNGMLVKLYPGREARALAIAAIGISVSTIILPPTMAYLLSFMGWREALLILAAGVLVLLWFFILAGVPADVGPASHPDDQVEGGVKLDLMRSAAFWLIGISVALGLTGAVVLAISYPPHFSSRGFSLTEAGWFISTAGVAGIFGKLMVAGVGDLYRHRAKWLAAGILVLQVAGFWILLFAEAKLAVALAVALLGFSGGAFLPIQPYLNSQYYDASVIGEVGGAQAPIFLPLGLFGLPMAGYVYDQTGSYDLVITALACAVSLAVVLLALLPSPSAD
jgi:predicted MFS family arabinose efflux permease